VALVVRLSFNVTVIVHAWLFDTAPRLDYLRNLFISYLQSAPESELSPQSFIAPQKNNYRSAASFALSSFVAQSKDVDVRA